ncbi:hypothetical protein COU59_01170 [Candidatus Pacearchaeota archaeon CG10_big_fil_rev_8_21_14_0_10_34_12]|nr:MAG: hypothetical protein COU59_01170 [Candidatus Pacearchaeota archaeon CG10_big_fil_rev_8_21_14_0_10_34_12]
MKQEVLFLLAISIFFAFTQEVFAITITEVELNPSGNDHGSEWIELYSKNSVDLEGYKLVNKDNGSIKLNGSFQGYYVYTFSTQWLDNSDEKVFLYKDSELIYETDIFEDSKNNDLTWQICDSWGFKESTKSEENSCEIEEDSQEDIEEETSAPAEDVDESSNNNANEEKVNNVGFVISGEKEKSKNESMRPITGEMIYLNAEDIKMKTDKENSGNMIAYYYGFLFFIAVAAFLFFAKRKRFKNEFD